MVTAQRMYREANKGMGGAKAAERWLMVVVVWRALCDGVTAGLKQQPAAGWEYLAPKSTILCAPYPYRRKFTLHLKTTAVL